MLSVKQGDIKYHFLSLWYDSTRDWTQVSRPIGEHSNHHVKDLIIKSLVLDRNTWNYNCEQIICIKNSYLKL